MVWENRFLKGTLQAEQEIVSVRNGLADGVSFGDDLISNHPQWSDENNEQYGIVSLTEQCSVSTSSVSDCNV